MTILPLSRLEIGSLPETSWNLAALQRHPDPAKWNAVRHQRSGHRRPAAPLRHAAAQLWHTAAQLWHKALYFRDVTLQKPCAYRNNFPNWNVTRVQVALKF
jgi:hypothetical protein